MCFQHKRKEMFSTYFLSGSEGWVSGQAGKDEAA